MSPLSFSIIIPTCRRPVQLAACLDAIGGLDYPRGGFEVIVVNDGGVEEPVWSAVGWRTYAVTIATQANAGPASARNHGGSLARGEFLAFVDDDCLPEPGWLSGLAARLERTPDRLVGGRTVNALTGNPYSETSQRIVDVVYAHYNADPERARFFATNNLAVEADRFRELGGFDESFRTSEDREFCDRWLMRGGLLTYAPDAVVRHAHRLSLRTFCRQHFDYGRGAFRYHRVRGRRGSGSLYADLAFHRDIRNWLLSPLSRSHGHGPLKLAGLLLTWQVANAAGFFAQAFRGVEEQTDDARAEPLAWAAVRTP